MRKTIRSVLLIGAIILAAGYAIIMINRYYSPEFELRRQLIRDIEAYLHEAVTFKEDSTESFTYFLNSRGSIEAFLTAIRNSRPWNYDHYMEHYYSGSLKTWDLMLLEVPGVSTFMQYHYGIIMFKNENVVLRLDPNDDRQLFTLITRLRD